MDTTWCQEFRRGYSDAFSCSDSRSSSWSTKVFETICSFRESCTEAQLQYTLQREMAYNQTPEMFLVEVTKEPWERTRGCERGTSESGSKVAGRVRPKERQVPENLSLRIASPLPPNFLSLESPMSPPSHGSPGYSPQVTHRTNTNQPTK